MPTLDQDSENYAIISHILFGSSINLNTHSFNMNANFAKDTDIFTDAKQSSFSLYNIYYDSNHEQVLKCKKTLDNLKARVHLLLIEWTENPLLLEILKIIKRIETFQLNDSLMKYLTGLELVLQKAENWQIVAAQKYSLEAELKQINELIVEWRKMELTFWQNSLELEYYEIKKKTAHVWFYNIFSCCAEFLKQSNDWFNNSEFLESLMQFIQTSTFGEYFIRMKNLKMCLQIFENYDVSSSSCSNSNPKARITELKNSLHSIVSFFDTVFSKLILDDILKNKKSIEKELKDFVAIHRWQDANYWSLKQSTAKSREKIFKTAKKFRVYLNQKLDFNKLVNSSMLNVCFLMNNTENKLNKTFKLGDLAQKKNSKFLGEMEKFTKKILTEKFFKTNFFDSITEYSTNLYERYLDLDVSTNSLTNQSKSLTKKDKELTDKLKKDAKNLNSQKCKFISDIMKDLNFMGLSYRKGQIMFSEKNQQLNKILMFDRPVFYESDQLKAFFTESEYNYYLCTHNFLSFKSLMSSQNLQQQADMGHLNVIPFQKLIGYADHFYHVINKQKDVLNKFISSQSHFKLLNQILTLVSDSNIFNQTLNRSQEMRVDYLNVFLNKALSLVKQIELFFKHLEKNCTDANQTTSIGASFQSINSKMDQLKNYLASSSKNPVLVDRLSQVGYHENKIKKAECLLKQLKLIFMNDRDFQELKQLNNCLNEENDLNRGLNDLLHTANVECKPFVGVFQQLINDLSNLNQQNDASQNQKVEVSVLKTSLDFY
jgi:midasin